MEEPNEVLSAGEPGPDIDELVARLRERVESRRRSGAYPPGLEDEMSAHFRRILDQRRGPRPAPDIIGAVRTAGEALPLHAGRIPLASGLPGGEALHKTVARVVSRQTQGVLQQVQGFAEPVQAALEALSSAVEQLSLTITVDVAQSLDALHERQAAQERILAGLGGADGGIHPPSFQPWYSSEHFEEAFRGSREQLLERYRDLAERFVGAEPVLDVGCGRGEFLELLTDVGVKATGVDLNAELVKAAAARGLSVTEDEGLRYLSNLDDQSLGGIALIQVIEHFSAQEIVDFVALAADKLRPGGQIFVETVNPQSLSMYARAFYLDPTHFRPVHPAYLAFLIREAGFAQVDIEWRSPPLAGDALEVEPPDSPAAALRNKNVQRLNELLFAPQDYLMLAVR